MLFDSSSPDISSLREELEDYYGSASPIFPMAMMEVDRVSQMSDEEVLEEARELGILED